MSATPIASAHTLDTSTLDIAIAPREVAFVDRRAEDAERFAAAANPNVDVVYLDGDRDGIEQISEYLAGRNDVSGIHLVGHGSAGQVQLGSTLLDRAALEGYRADLQQWSASLTDEADILLYGCDVASTADGEALVSAIAGLTGADVAASDDATGSAALGGDWDLEFFTGAIQANLAFQRHFLATYESILRFALPNYIYGIDGTSIFVIDATTGTRTQVGTTAFTTFAITREAETGRLYYVEANAADPGQARVAYWQPAPSLSPPGTPAGDNVIIGTVDNANIDRTFVKLAQAVDGSIYAITSGREGDFAARQLFRIDINNGGRATLVNEIAPARPGVLVGGQPLDQYTYRGGDAAFAPGGNPNTLYVTSNPRSGDADNATDKDQLSLYAIDVTTARSTYLGAFADTGTRVDRSGVGALTFGPNGNLYFNSNNQFYEYNFSGLGAPGPAADETVLLNSTDVGPALAFDDFGSLPVPTDIVDLDVTIDDGLDNVQPGEPVTYTVTVTNTTGQPLSLADVATQIDIPPQLKDVTWEATTVGGGSFVPNDRVFPTPADKSGTGNTINSTANIDPGASIVYTIKGNVDPNAAGGVIDGTVTTKVGHSQGAFVDIPTTGLIDNDTNNVGPQRTATNPTTINTPPVAQNGTVTIPPSENPQTNIPIPDLVGTDPEDTNPTSFRIDSLPAVGTLQFQGNPVVPGQVIPFADRDDLTYDAPAGILPANLGFDFVALDSSGDPVSGTSPTARVSLVSGPNQPPVPTNLTRDVAANTTLGAVMDKVAGGGFDAPATDPNPVGEDRGKIGEYIITALPNQGTLFLDANGNNKIDSGETITVNQPINAADLPNLDFKSPVGFTGTTFTYKAVDNSGDPATNTSPNATVTIQPNPIPPAVNQPPTVQGGSANQPGPGQNINVTTLLQGNDPDGTVQRFEITKLPTVGRLLLNGIPVTNLSQVANLDPAGFGNLVYEPPATGFNNADFEYVAYDDDGAVSGPAAIQLNPANPNNTPPTANNATQNLIQGSTVPLPPLGGSDPEDTNPTAFIIDTLPQGGTLLLNGIPVAQGQRIPFADRGNLSFRSDPGGTTTTTNFRFSSVDSAGLLSPAPGVVTLNLFGNAQFVPPTPPATPPPQQQEPEIDIAGSPGGIPDGTPDPVNFGATTVGGTLSQSFTIRNTGGAPLSFCGLQLPPGFVLVNSSINLETGSLPPGGSAIFEVSFTGTQTGTFGGNILLCNNDADESTYNFPVQVDVFDRLPNDPNDPDQGIDRPEEPVLACPGDPIPGLAAFEVRPPAEPTLPPVEAALPPAALRRLSVSLGGDLDGGATNDLLLGDDGNNRLRGRGADDEVLGFGGDDLLFGNSDDETDDRAPQNDRLGGSTGNDTLNGNEGDDVLYAGRDNDLAHGGQGNDLVYGDRDNDTLHGDRGNDTVFGGTGSEVPVGPGRDDDWLYGNTGNDLLNGSQGNDSVYAGQGDDFARGGKDDDWVYGDRGSDTLLGDTGNDTLVGGTGFDFLPDPEGRDLMFGGSGDDVMNGNEAADTLLGETGNDSMHGGRDDDLLFGGDGGDTIHGDRGNDIIFGSNGSEVPVGPGSDDDFLYGNDGNDSINAGQGNDTVRAGQGDDLVFAGKDDDLIYGDRGNDSLSGDLGNDTIFGGTAEDFVPDPEGRDLLLGGGGNDLVNGNAGDDTVAGGDGNDTLYGGRDNDSLQGDAGEDIVYGDRGNDTIFGGDDNDTLYGDTQDPDDSPEAAGNDFICAGGGDDWVFGHRGNDELNGFDGNDTIFGGRDNDTLFGNDGDDWLWGDRGSDVLLGGAGADTFAIGQPEGDGDAILDFQVGIDAIALVGDLTFADLTFVPLEGGRLAIEAGIRDGSPEESRRLATLEGVASLDETSFVGLA